ncbi:MAG: GGDEF domain-containing protein [Pseudomonadota bacterium]
MSDLYKKRSTEQLIMMLLSAAAAAAIAPFAILRSMQGQWLLAAVDAGLVLVFAAVALFVFFRRRLGPVSYAICIAGFTGTTATIYIAGAAQMTWLFPVILMTFYLVKPLPATALSIIGVSVVLPELLGDISSENLMTLLSTIGLSLALTYAFSQQTVHQHEQLIELATKDPLTGAYNRRALSDALTELIAKHNRNPVTASMLLLDLDHFKRVNDAFGHAVGDSVLVGFVNIVRQRIRSNDRLYRVGGEEFVVLADGADASTAEKLAEDLRVLVEAARLADSQTVTVSVGVAQLLPGETSDDWLRRGDNALYSAKHAGRNKVVSANGAPRALTAVNDPHHQASA